MFTHTHTHKFLWTQSEIMWQKDTFDLVISCLADHAAIDTSHYRTATRWLQVIQGCYWMVASYCTWLLWDGYKSLQDCYGSVAGCYGLAISHFSQVLQVGYGLFRPSATGWLRIISSKCYENLLIYCTSLSPVLTSMTTLFQYDIDHGDLDHLTLATLTLTIWN